MVVLLVITALVPMVKNKTKKVFTIIEILIVFTIVIVLSVIGFANYQNYSEEVKLKNEVKKFIDVFELIKKKAITSDLYDKNCSDFNGYKILINSNGSDYEIFFGCYGNYSKIQTYSLSNNLIFTNGFNSVFYFPPILGGLDIKTNNLTIKNKTINKCINIYINEKGVIDVNESLFSC